MKSKRKPKGVVLILALWFLSGLSLLSLGFAHRTRLEIKITGFHRDRLIGFHLAKAAVKRAVIELKNDANFYDSLDESWHRHPSWQEEGWFIDGEGKSEVDGDVVYEVADEEGKININTASLEILERLPDVTPEVASSIIDWRDPDSFGEAENSYYENLDPPYKCRDAPFEVIGELLLVKGVTPELFFGEDTNQNGQLDPNEDDGSLTPPDDDMDGELKKGFKDWVTVYGDGRINLNTASSEVLAAIPGITEETAKEMVKYRAGKDGQEGTEDDKHFETMEDLLEVVNEYEYHQLQAVGKLTSGYFTITSVAKLHKGKIKKKIVATVKRSSGSAQILSWREN